MQLDSLLRGRGGLLAPQVQAVAAWLIALDPGRFDTLLSDDPAAFIQSSVELRDPSYRKTLVSGLVELAQASELPDMWGFNLAGLAYDGIEDDLRNFVVSDSSSVDAQYLVIRIVRACQLRGLLGTLTEIALDPERPVNVRNAAGHGILDLSSGPEIQSLTVLVDAGGSEVDEDDELFGLGLLAELATGTSLDSLLPLLRNERNPDLFGTYRQFLMFVLPENLQSPNLVKDDMVAALRWAAMIERDATDDRLPELVGLLVHVEELFDAVLTAGLRRLEEIEVLEGVADLIAIRVGSHHHLRRSQRTELPEIHGEDKRRSLLLALHARLDATHEVWFIEPPILRRDEDFAWIVERAGEASSSDERQTWATWIRVTYSERRPDHTEQLTAFLDRIPEYRDMVGFLLEPRPDFAREDVEVMEDDQSAPAPTEVDIRRRLEACLALRSEDGFYHFCHWAQFVPGQRRSHHTFELEVERLPSGLLTSGQEQEVVVLARKYLEEATPDPENVLGSDRVAMPAFAGTRAFVFLQKRGIVPELSDDRWRLWVPALVHGPFNNSESEQLASALSRAFERVPVSVLAATEKEMQGRGDLAQFILAPDRACSDGRCARVADPSGSRQHF